MSRKSDDTNSNGINDFNTGSYTIYNGNSMFDRAFRNRSGGGQYPWQDSSFHGKGLSNSNYIPNQNYMKETKSKSHDFDSTEKSPTKNDSQMKSDKNIMDLLSGYAEKCSLNGIIFIKTSKYLVVKGIWTFLLLIALVGMVIHLYMLATTYYSYEKQSKVDLKFENLKFPAVTFCNVNAMKLSEASRASEQLQELIFDVNPTQMENMVDEWEPSYQEETYHFDESGDYMGSGSDWWSSASDWDNSGWDDSGSGASGSGTGTGSGSSSGSGSGWTRKKRSTADSSEKSGSNIRVKSRTNSFFDDYNFTDFSGFWEDMYSGDTFSGSWESESQPAAFEQITGEFINLYNQENGTTRQKMGHSIQDMLIQCAFVGRKCVQSNFSLVASSTMGNCYTIQYDKFMARKSGPREGLTLMLNLEIDEYVPGITNSKGVKLVVHEPGTIPFPDDEGMAIAAGMETSIGLRRTAISRLGKPYGDCTDVDTFRKKHGIKYTRQACQETCEMEEISEACNCYDANKPFIYTLTRKRNDLKPCQSVKEKLWCMEDVQWSFQSNSSCHCSSPCQEISYKKTISSKPWPSLEFGNLLAKTVCKEKPDNVLCLYDLMDEDRLREYFIKINVYFETLNYEKISEEPDYSEFQFISDIGGTVGLYVGISALSAFEILHLFISIIRHLFFRWRNSN